MVSIVGGELGAFFKTPHSCADPDCDEPLKTTDEIVLIEIVYPVKVGDEIKLHRIDNGRGAFEYDPVFLHLDCWEGIEESLHELLEDVPPMPDDYSIFECSACKSGIRSWESSCLISPGELRRSVRAPNGTPDLELVECLGPPKMLCASCTRSLNEDIFQMWENGFSHNEECDEGTHIRCWRNGECHDVSCKCPKGRAAQEQHG